MTQAADAHQHEAPGWYGKIASLGDFAQRRLPHDVIQRIDAWLSCAMAASRQHLGPQWPDAYLIAPVLRFAWAPGVEGPQWWFGVLMPSCDNVGRYYPLIVAQPRARPPQDAAALDHLEAWFDHIAQAAASTLDEQTSLAGFEQALRNAPPWPPPQPPPVTFKDAPVARVRRQVAGGEEHRFDARAALAQWLHALAAEELQARFGGCSIWWRRVQGEPDAVVTVLQGLPDPSAFATLLTARSQATG